MFLKLLVFAALVSAIQCAAVDQLPAKYKKLNDWLSDHKGSKVDAYLKSQKSLSPEETEAAKLYGQVMSKKLSCNAADSAFLAKAAADMNLDANPDHGKRFKVHKDLADVADKHAAQCAAGYKKEYERLEKKVAGQSGRAIASNFAEYFIPGHDQWAGIRGNNAPVQAQRTQAVEALDSIEVAAKNLIDNWREMASMPERAAFEVIVDEKSGERMIDREASDKAVKLFMGYSLNFIKVYKDFLEGADLDALVGKNKFPIYPVLCLETTALKVLEKFVQMDEQELADAVYEEASKQLAD